MQLKPGQRLMSTVDSTEVIVILAPKAEVSVECGGHPMISNKADAPQGLSLVPEFAGGTALGKRYTDDGGTMELLCTRAGQGSLSNSGTVLVLKEARALPASD